MFASSHEHSFPSKEELRAVSASRLEGRTEKSSKKVTVSIIYNAHSRD